MLLAVDIGNSTISTGLFGLDGELRFLASLDTDYRKTADQICVDLMNLFQLYHFRYEDVTDSILCSVVPPLNFMMEKALTRLLGKPPVVVGPGVKTGLNIRLAVQSQVGGGHCGGRCVGAGTVHRAHHYHRHGYRHYHRCHFRGTDL